jgi:nucleoside-diphosphate-sugar epimerase
LGDPVVTRIRNAPTGDGLPAASHGLHLPIMNTEELHVVLGAGQIGTLLTPLLLQAGHRVRQIRRGPVGSPLQANHEWLGGDMCNLAFAERATAGASVVYDCMNPPYDRWDELLLALGRGSLHGAAQAGARLVALDNLYAYGRPSGAILPSTPENPCSHKGMLRKALAAERLDAHRQGRVQVAIARASDFVGPGMTLAAVFGERFFKRALHGRAVECFGDPDQPHSYSYGPDVARALFTLGADDAALGRVWLLPVNPPESTRQVVDRLGTALGHPIRIVKIPDFALQAMGVFWPLAREIAEMTYQWKVPYVVDDSAFRTVFGITPTPWDQVVRATLDWAKPLYAPRAAA